MISFLSRYSRRVDNIIYNFKHLIYTLAREHI